MKNRVRAITLAATALAAVGAWAQSAIYTPVQSLNEQGISLSRWGSGTISETTEMAFEGTTSLRISSRNYFQGGIVTFKKPIDLSVEAQNKDNLLLIALALPQGAGGGTTGGPGRGPGRPGASGSAGAGEGGGSSSANGGAPTGPTSGGSTAGSSGAAAVIKKMRVVITTDDGKKSEAYVDVSSGISGDRGWRRVGIPLTAIAGFDKTSKKVVSMAFAPDSVGSFYVGEMKILKDETPVYVEPNVRELNLALGDSYILNAIGTGGATPLRYTWDFDSKDGITVDAEGEVIQRTFRKPGEYTITLTVQDVYGLKKAYSTTIKVIVNP